MFICPNLTYLCMDTTNSGWNWSQWDASKRMLIGCFIATGLTMFLSWREFLFVKKIGLEAGEAWVALGLLAYPAIQIFRGKDVNKILAIILCTLAVVWGFANIASNLETIEADGFLVEEDTVLDINGIGAYLFVPISVIALIGSIKYKPAKFSVAAQNFSPLHQPAFVPGNLGPDVSLIGNVDANGYEWIVHQGQNYWRIAGSGSQWTLHQ